jgi:hypothetical protein
MNYIHQLRADNESLKREITAIKASLSDLRGYLHSSKFNCGDRLDHYVNIADVLGYLRDTEDAALRHVRANSLAQ